MTFKNPTEIPKCSRNTPFHHHHPGAWDGCCCCCCYRRFPRHNSPTVSRPRTGPLPTPILRPRRSPREECAGGERAACGGPAESRRWTLGARSACGSWNRRGQSSGLPSNGETRRGEEIRDGRRIPPWRGPRRRIGRLRVSSGGRRRSRSELRKPKGPPGGTFPECAPPGAAVPPPGGRGEAGRAAGGRLLSGGGPTRRPRARPLRSMMMIRSSADAPVAKRAGIPSRGGRDHHHHHYYYNYSL
mmetsp:Transcript_3251/g.7843  ORF Transcript_3251/g.7843 Transcript_3251/m.7843 type:complete len:244 (+) Transcript_3251:304-1035(+)